MINPITILFGEEESQRIITLDRPHIRADTKFQGAARENEEATPSLELSNLLYQPVRETLVSYVPKLKKNSPLNLVESLYLMEPIGNSDSDDLDDVYMACTSTDFIEKTADYKIKNYIDKYHHLTEKERKKGSMALKAFYSPYLIIPLIESENSDELGIAEFNVLISVPLLSKEVMYELFDYKIEMTNKMTEEIEKILDDVIINESFILQLLDIDMTIERPIEAGQQFIADYHKTQVNEFPPRLLITISLKATNEAMLNPDSAYVENLSKSFKQRAKKI